MGLMLTADSVTLKDRRSSNRAPQPSGASVCVTTCDSRQQFDLITLIEHHPFV